MNFNWQRDKENKKKLLESLRLTHTDEEIAVLVTGKWPQDGVATKWSVTKQRQRWKLRKPDGGVQKGLREDRGLESIVVPESNEKESKDFSQLLQENRRLITEVEKERLKTDKILDAVKSAIIKLPAYKPSKTKTIKKKHGSEDMALAYSDSQIGEKTTLLDTSGLSEYNFDIFKKEARTLETKVKLIWDIQSQAYHIGCLWILGLGDFITGEGVFPGQAHYIDHVVVDQVFEGVQVIGGMIRNLCLIFPKVRIVMVSGQHGRGPKEYHWRSNWDYVFGKVLQLILQDVENCEVIVAESALCALEIKNHVFLLNHGTDIRSWMTIPFYGLERAALRWVNLTRLPVEYVLIGDKHRNCSFDIAYMEAMINGAWSPGTKFSIDKMQGAGYPKQKLFGIHGDIGKTYEYDLKLSEPPRLVPDKKGFYTPVS